MIAFGGIQKLFTLFKKYANRDIKISTSLCIEHLLRAKGITDQSMRREIIQYLKMRMNEGVQLAKNAAKQRLIGLARYFKQIIWPPEDATEVPVVVRAIVEGRWKALFSMRDYTWLNTRKYVYGVLGSNDQNTFSGENDQEEKPIEVEVDILEGEYFVNFYIFQKIGMWIWIIPFVAAGIACLIICIIVYCIWKRFNQKKIAKEEAERRRDFDRERKLAKNERKKSINKKSIENEYHQSQDKFRGPPMPNPMMGSGASYPQMTEFARQPKLKDDESDSDDDIQVPGQRDSSRDKLRTSPYLSQAAPQDSLSAYAEQLRSRLDEIENREENKTSIKKLYSSGIEDFQYNVSQMQSIELGEVNPSVTALIVQIEITKKSVKIYIHYQWQVKDNKIVAFCLEYCHRYNLMGKRKRLLVEQGFQIIRKIGKGGFSRVYQVSKPGIGVVAAKVMKEEDFNMKEWQVGFKLAKYKSICIEVPFCTNVWDSDSHFDGNLDCLIESKLDLPIPVIRAIMRQLRMNLI
ncbi:MAG: hypothetical protein EZS28_006965 [Streblomastix strix]|uniref:Protein kinase domain-containing protein n=1 Tax=Streblomastix strix TaxID=222440 RepID=A0A5J4WQZ2_9EUKA|nr:MAG: hypothetical protein EZS28_006965 [Streblomastix strix]